MIQGLVDMNLFGGKAHCAIFAYNFAFHTSVWGVIRQHKHLQRFCVDGAPCVCVATNHDPFLDRKQRLTALETQFGMKRFNFVGNDEEGRVNLLYEHLARELLQHPGIAIVPPPAMYPPPNNRASFLHPSIVSVELPRWENKEGGCEGLFHVTS
jgi:hypothetical protein